MENDSTLVFSARSGSRLRRRLDQAADGAEEAKQRGDVGEHREINACASRGALTSIRLSSIAISDPRATLADASARNRSRSHAADGSVGSRAIFSAPSKSPALIQRSIAAQTLRFSRCERSDSHRSERDDKSKHQDRGDGEHEPPACLEEVDENVANRSMSGLVERILTADWWRLAP